MKATQLSLVLLLALVSSSLCLFFNKKVDPKNFDAITFFKGDWEISMKHKVGDDKIDAQVGIMHLNALPNQHAQLFGNFTLKKAPKVAQATSDLDEEIKEQSKKAFGFLFDDVEQSPKLGVQMSIISGNAGKGSLTFLPLDPAKEKNTLEEDIDDEKKQQKVQARVDFNFYKSATDNYISDDHLSIQDEKKELKNSGAAQWVLINQNAWVMFMNVGGKSVLVMEAKRTNLPQQGFLSRFGPTLLMAGTFIVPRILQSWFGFDPNATAQQAQRDALAAQEEEKEEEKESKKKTKKSKKD